MASDLEQQLGQLDELLGLLDASALRRAQEALENQIAELTERLEVTRQALVHAQIQRRRLARARLLLEESAPEGNGEVDPAFRPGDVDPAFRPGDVDPAFRPASSPAAAPQRLPEITAPFVADRRLSEERRANGERREVQDRRKNEKTPPAA